MKSPETLGGENKIDFTGGMEVGVYGSMRGQVCSEMRGREGVETWLELRTFEWWCGNLVQLKPCNVWG